MRRLIKSVVFSVLSLSVILAPLASRAAADWPQWRGQNRDGIHQGTSWPNSINDNMPVAWERGHSPSYSGPIVVGGLAYTTETENKKIEKVTAYQVDTGEVAWTVQWPGAMSVPFFAAANGDWIRSTPACDGDALVVMGMRDVLVCLDAKNGDERWRVDFPSSLGTPLPAFGAVCSPVIDGDAVYVQTGGPTVKLSLKDGSMIWQTLSSGNNKMSGGAFSSPVIATLQGVRQLVVQTRQELCGVDMETGDPLWRESIEAFRGMNILTPCVIGDRIFTAAHSGRSQLFEIRRSDQSEWTVHELWSQKTKAYMSSPVVIDDQIYLHAQNRRIVALSLEDGSIRWTSKPFGKYWSMIQHGDQILALDADGELMLINHDTKKLNIQERRQVADNAWAHIAIAGNRVFIRDLRSLKVFSFL